MRLDSTAMPAPDLIVRIRRRLVETGPRQTLLFLCRRIYRRAFPVKFPTPPFDLQYGVDTAGLIDGKRLGSGHAHDRHITAYWGTAPSLLQNALARWEESLANTDYSCPDYSFIDIGCGKGRALMLASDWPFRNITGIEVNPGLASIAKKNLTRWNASSHACADIVVFNADALDFALPESPALIYLFNPFRAQLIQLLLDRIHTLSIARSSPIDFIYARPEHASLFDLVPNMRLLCQGEAALTPAETAADAFHTRTLDYRIYRLPPCPRH